MVLRFCLFYYGIKWNYIKYLADIWKVVMKKFTLFVLLFFLVTGFGYAQEDKFSAEYLKNNKHFAIMNPLAECLAEHSIAKSLKKETGGKYDVKFTGYTLSSMKKGIFKSLEITGTDMVTENIPLPYVYIKSLSDYNYIDYQKEPPVFKSDMTFYFEVDLSEDSMNIALKDSSYKKTLDTINNITYPLFQITGVSTKIRNNRIYILTEYNFPIAPSSKNRVFVASSDFQVANGDINAVNIKIDSAYGNVSLHKVANLINMLDPLDFTMSLLETKQGKAKIENVKIVDNKVRIDGKIFVKGD